MKASHDLLALLRQTHRTLERPTCRACQRRWAQTHDIRFILTRQKSSSVFEKYQSKLEQKARAEGKSNVEELRDAYKDKIQMLRHTASIPGATAPLHPSSDQPKIPYQAPPPPTPAPSTAAATGKKEKVRTLGDLINIEKTSALSPKEIEAVWRLLHIKDPQSICAIMGNDTFQRIVATARKHSQFILPIPREGQGAEIHFMQWTFPSPTTVTVLFTHLAEFKLRGEFAQPHTTVTHHLDMSESKGLVLLEGRVTESRGVSVDEAKWLLLCLQKFYGFEALSPAAQESLEKRRRLMEQFSHGDEAFRIEELLEEAEKVP